jgi:hypothetical protein
MWVHFGKIGKIVSIDLYERKVLRKKFAEVCLWKKISFVYIIFSMIKKFFKWKIIL